MQLKKSGVRISHASMNEIFDILIKENWVKRNSSGQWCMIRDLGELTLMDLYKILPCKLPNNMDRPTNKWQKSLQGVLADCDASLSVSLAIPVSKALKYSE
jgi:hypothetical protein